MSRRGNRATNREISPDQKYGSELVGKMINMVMKSGKKQLACGIVWEALERLYTHEMKKSSAQAKAKATEAEQSDDDHGGEGSGSVVLDKPAQVVAYLEDVVAKAGPEVELVSKRLGGANIQAPVAVRAQRKITLALRSLIKNARNRISQQKSMASALAQEMIDVVRGSAKTLDEKEQLLRMAKANAVFQGMRRG